MELIERKTNLMKMRKFGLEVFHLNALINYKAVYFSGLGQRHHRFSVSVRHFFCSRGSWLFKIQLDSHFRRRYNQFRHNVRGHGRHRWVLRDMCRRRCSFVPCIRQFSRLACNNRGVMRVLWPMLLLTQHLRSKFSYISCKSFPRRQWYTRKLMKLPQSAANNRKSNGRAQCPGALSSNAWVVQKIRRKSVSLWWQRVRNRVPLQSHSIRTDRPGRRCWGI